MKIVVSNDYEGPIYEQIKNQILQAILTNEILPGDVLPSLRGLARDLKVGVLTVNRAYTELENEGYIENIQGKGCFVAQKSSELIKDRLMKEAKQKMADAVKEAKMAGAGKEEIADLFMRCLKEM